MDWKAYPSLNSLRAFATVAETRSYSRAGATLNISHAAVSQQIKGLEARLGVVLVVREGRGIKLTHEGIELARQLEKGFAVIREGVEAVTGADAMRPVQISMSPAFGARWLLPRLRDFQQRHPKITLMLNSTADVVELVPGGIDIAIRFGNGHWPGLDVSPLLLPSMVVVGARELVGTEKLDPLKLAEFPWLQEAGTQEVTDWLSRRGITPQRPVEITHMPGNLIMEAVQRGDGLTFTARCFVSEEVESGRLVELFSEDNCGGYYIVTRSNVLRPSVLTFTKWLKQQAETIPRNNQG
jgi:LysR family transcriptional regulator, glycine cleavage system transcriptional activator